MLLKALFAGVSFLVSIAFIVRLDCDAFENYVMLRLVECFTKILRDLFFFSFNKKLLKTFIYYQVNSFNVSEKLT